MEPENEVESTVRAAETQQPPSQHPVERDEFTANFFVFFLALRIFLIILFLLFLLFSAWGRGLNNLGA